jgi:hypothetical protein
LLGFVAQRDEFAEDDDAAAHKAACFIKKMLGGYVI